MQVERTWVEGMQAPATTSLVPLARCTRTTCRVLSAPDLQTPATPGWTRNTSNNRKSYTRNKKKTGKNFSSSRKKNTSSSQDKVPMMPGGSRSSSGTSNRQSNYRSGTPSSRRGCSKDSRKHALLRREKENREKGKRRNINRDLPCTSTRLKSWPDTTGDGRKPSPFLHIIIEPASNQLATSARSLSNCAKSNPGANPFFSASGGRMAYASSTHSSHQPQVACCVFPQVSTVKPFWS